MARLTAAELVDAIARLGTSRAYGYVSGQTNLRLTRIQPPEGPIGIVRWGRDELESAAKPARISRDQLAHIALACSNKPNYPLHVDRLFSAGGNSRSALETLLAYTPHFFMCYPQRIDSYTGEILTNLKHIMWCPDDEHAWGEIAVKPYEDTITEFELDIDFGAIDLSNVSWADEFDTIEAARTHTQMQIALVTIGNALNFRTWIASNDRHIPIGNTTLGNLEGVIQSLENVSILHTLKIKEAAAFID